MVDYTGIACPDREFICRDRHCLDLGHCGQPFSKIEKLADAIAVAVLNENGTTTKTSLREALVDFVNEIRKR